MALRSISHTAHHGQTSTQPFNRITPVHGKPVGISYDGTVWRIRSASGRVTVCPTESAYWDHMMFLTELYCPDYPLSAA